MTAAGGVVFDRSLVETAASGRWQKAAAAKAAVQGTDMSLPPGQSWCRERSARNALIGPLRNGKLPALRNLCHDTQEL